MRFYIDSKTRKVTAYNRPLGEVARAVLHELGESVPDYEDPVKFAFKKLADRGVIFNLSQALEAIAESDDKAAQELALEMKKAVDYLYKELKN